MNWIKNISLSVARILGTLNAKALPWPLMWIACRTLHKMQCSTFGSNQGTLLSGQLMTGTKSKFYCNPYLSSIVHFFICTSRVCNSQSQQGRVICRWQCGTDKGVGVRVGVSLPLSRRANCAEFDEAGTTVGFFFSFNLPFVSLSWQSHDLPAINNCTRSRLPRRPFCLHHFSYGSWVHPLCQLAINNVMRLGKLDIAVYLPSSLQELSYSFRIMEKAALQCFIKLIGSHSFSLLFEDWSNFGEEIERVWKPADTYR